MNKPLLIAYNVVLVLAAAGALWWYSTTKAGPPELADGTRLTPFSGQWPADWPADLRVISADGVWADSLNTTAPDGPTREHVSGQFFFEQPLEEVERDLGLALRDGFGHVSTVNVSQDGQPMQGFFLTVLTHEQAERGFISATVLASPATGKVGKNPGARLETLVTIRYLRLKPGHAVAPTPQGSTPPPPPAR